MRSRELQFKFFILAIQIPYACDRKFALPYTLGSDYDTRIELFARNRRTRVWLIIPQSG